MRLLVVQGRVGRPMMERRGMGASEATEMRAATSMHLFLPSLLLAGEDFADEDANDLRRCADPQFFEFARPEHFSRHLRGA